MIFFPAHAGTGSNMNHQVIEDSAMSKKVVIVGGVAGGMSCAARLKRLDDSMQVTVFEQGPEVSFANCGMPYYVGGVIENRKKLLVQTPKGLRNRYDLAIHVNHRVTRIDRESRQVEVIDLPTGEKSFHPYDILVLSTGASPIRPDIPIHSKASVFVLNNLKDMDDISHAASSSRSVCVVGGGFIGLELAENFRHKGLEVHLVELLDQVMPPIDPEMARPVLQELELNGVKVHLSEKVVEVGEKEVHLASGSRIAADFVCLCAGVKPNSTLAVEAGLDVGPRGHIRVDGHMLTSDPSIYAIGDVAETVDFVTGTPVAVPLAGPANRQGRLVAGNICGRDSEYRRTQATSIVKVFNLAVACTGLSEKRLKTSGLPYRRAYVHPTSHPGYYPDARIASIKLLFSPEGSIYGAQVIGGSGVDSIINTLATAQRAGLKVDDLEHLELAYAPQWGGAKHPVNIAGFVAGNILNGDVESVEADSIPADALVIDCRSQAEAESGALPGSILIPVDELRERFTEIPREREVVTYCAVGMRGYVAARFLRQKGYRVKNLNGGYRTWSWFQARRHEAPGEHPDGPKPDKVQPARGAGSPANSEVIRLDVSGLQCPGPMVQVKNRTDQMEIGQILEVIASDPGFPSDIPTWCQRTGNQLLEVKAEQGKYFARILKQAPGAGKQDKSGGLCSTGPRPDGKTLVCFSNDLDRVLATFVIANGAVAMGSPVTIFFTFWGLNVLRKETPPPVEKGFLDRMFGMMMPKGPNRLKLSQMNMAGMGAGLMKYIMRTKNISSLPELVASAQKAGVRFVACSMSMDVMGIKKEELIDGVEIAGVANFLGMADESNMTLFV